MPETKEETTNISVRLPVAVVDRIDWVVETHSNMGKEITRTSWLKDVINKELRNQTG